MDEAQGDGEERKRGVLKYIDVRTGAINEVICQKRLAEWPASLDSRLGVMRNLGYAGVA